MSATADATNVHDKAAILSEALPYIREFSGKTVVIKYGGHTMEDPALADLFAQDVVLMRLVGMNPVVVHGGGPQISDLMHRLGKVPEFVDGLRVTDAETVDIVRMALVGKVNREVVAAVNQHGSLAVGLSGEDAGLITVKIRDERLGFVGDVTRIDASILERLIHEELIPIVATVGVDEGGQAYNVNADTVAGAIAEAVGAEKLVYLTDVAGLYEDFGDEGSLISRIDVDGLERLASDGKLSEGMIPKIRSCIDALRQRRVARAHPRRPYPARAASGVLHAGGHRHDDRTRRSRSVARAARSTATRAGEHDCIRGDPGARRRVRNADLRAVARGLRARRGREGVGQRGQRVPRLPRGPRGHRARPRAPGRRRRRRRPGPHAPARLEPLLQRRAAPGRGAPRRVARRRWPCLLRQFRRRGQRVPRSSSHGVTARPTAGPSATTCSRRSARSTAGRSPRSRPPASHRSRRRSSRCRRGSGRWASAISTRSRPQWTSGCAR